MKLTQLLLCAICAMVLATSCKKDNDDDKNNTPDAYYFKANINGQEFLYEGQSLQSGSGFMAHCGGYVTTVTNLLEGGGLFLEIDTSDSPSEASILALLNDTLTVDDNVMPYAIVQFDSTTYFEFSTLSLNSSQQSGYVVLTEINPLGPDEFDNWNVYAVKGNFKANVGMDGNFRGQATGDFYMRLTTNR